MSAKFFADHDILDIPDDPDLHVRWIESGYSVGVLTSYRQYFEELYYTGLLIPAFSYARYMPPEVQEMYKNTVNRNILPVAIRVPNSRLHVTSPKFSTGPWGENGPHFSSNVPWVGVGTLHDPMPNLEDSTFPLVHVIDLRQYFLFLLMEVDNEGSRPVPPRIKQSCLLSTDSQDPVFHLQQHNDSTWELLDYLAYNGAPFAHSRPANQAWYSRRLHAAARTDVLPPEFIRSLVKKPMLPIPVRA